MPFNALRTPPSRRLGLLLTLLGLIASGFASSVWAARGHQQDSAEVPHLPWREAGLTERQAAAHLLDRFAYGPRPGDINRVVEIGLDRWFMRQLDGNLPDAEVDALLRRRPTLQKSAAELAKQYPPPGRLFQIALREGVIDRPTEDDAMADDAIADEARPDADPQRRRTLERWAREQGFKSQREAMADLMIQKLARARYSENQLHEVLTDFWFNHFNVSLTDNEARIYLWPFERDAIRAHVTGSFRDMLGAAARHPAMLLYLDNARSIADGETTTTLDRRLEAMNFGGRGGARGSRSALLRRRQDRRIEDRRPQGPGRPTGLNENYARELMELHTLGVDGGYSQDDVVAVARAFTGWSPVPPDGLPGRLGNASDRRRRRAGFVVDGAFLFRADGHDAESKEVLGHRLAAGRGIEDGEQVLDLLAAHPSTARHLATKLATRFVSDQPADSLVDRLARTYETTSGDLRSLLVTLAESPEFWSEKALHQKIKSPFELTMSALRATQARPKDPRSLVEWIGRMGQPLYAYQAPTGYPDRAEAWVNTGALLHRMNFGLQLATNRLPGVRLDLSDLAAEREVDGRESAEDLLRWWLARLLPERDPEPTVRRLLPIVEESQLANRSAHVVGVILGSPEFQRR